LPTPFFRQLAFQAADFTHFSRKHDLISALCYTSPSALYSKYSKLLCSNSLRPDPTWPGREECVAKWIFPGFLCTGIREREMKRGKRRDSSTR
jgi:hypothetical protein